MYPDAANLLRPAAPTVKEVLLVEDEDSSRRAMSLLLMASGYRPQAFASAEEALEEIRSRGIPPVALVDLDLPGMNGLELISELKKLNPSVHPVLVTATDEYTLANKLRQQPVAYLRKPVDFDMLLGLLADPKSPQ